MRAFLQENIGIVLDKQGKLAEAMELYQKVLQVRVATLGPEHPDVADSKYNIAVVKEAQGDLEEARTLFLECEQIYAKVHGADHEETLDAARRAQTVGEEDEGESEEGESEEGEEDRDDAGASP